MVALLGKPPQISRTDKLLDLVQKGPMPGLETLAIPDAELGQLGQGIQ